MTTATTANHSTAATATTIAMCRNQATTAVSSATTKRSSAISTSRNLGNKDQKDGNDHGACQLGPGRHTVTAMPYFGAGAQGQGGVPFRVSFFIDYRNDTASQKPIATEAQEAALPYRTSVAPKLLNLVALSSLAVDATWRHDGAIVWLQATVQNDEIGAYGGTITASCPGRPTITGTFPIAESTTRGLPTRVKVGLSFPRYISQGDYALSVRLINEWGNYNIKHDALTLTQKKFPSQIQVYNSGVLDTTPPELVKLYKRSSTTIDVSITPPEPFVLKIVAKDDKSGIDWGRLRLVHADDLDGRILHSIELSVDKRRVSQTVAIPTHRIYVPGMYNLKLHLTDKANNTQSVNALSLQIVNPLYESLELLNMVALAPAPFSGPFLVVDVTTWAATFVLQLVVQSSYPRLTVNATVILTPHRASPYDDVAFRDILQYTRRLQNLEAGAASLCNVTVCIPRSFRPGSYDISIHLIDDRLYTGGRFRRFGVDEYDNYFGTTIDSTTLARRNLYSTIEVLNDNPDVTPPRLVDVAILSPLSPLLGHDVVELLVTAHDDLSGVSEVSIDACGDHGGRLTDTSFHPYPNATAKEHLVQLRLNLNVSKLCAETLKFGFTLWDHAGNMASVDSNTLLKLGRPGFIQLHRLCL